MTGFHLKRTDENVSEIDALATALGGRVGLNAVLDDLNRTGRRSWLPARAVHRAWTFDRRDRVDPRWWPQGISTSADASPTETVGGRRIVAVAWYAKQLPGEKTKQGSRITFYDLDARRYRHVLLVVPTLKDGVAGLEPLHVHAGGIVWCGPYLHVAATARGFFTVRLDDLLRLPDDAPGIPGADVDTFGYRYVLPVRFAYRAATDEGVERLRYSFMSLDRAPPPPGLLVGEYGHGSDKTHRLVRFELDDETLLPATDESGAARPVWLADGVGQMQGAVMARGRLHVTVSQGRSRFGSVFTGDPDSPEGLRRYRWATPMGPEDVAYWPSADELISVSEHPFCRWIFTMRRSWFD